MPLVMMCGYPCSGKTTFVTQLAGFLEKHEKRVVVVSDEVLAADRNTTYHGTEGNEKELRGDLRSQVQKYISRDTVVILDSLNYIKGFRYELFCISKNNKTPHCVVHMTSPLESCLKWNSGGEKKYQPELMEELAMRFEPPNPSQRWDSPCFLVKEDAASDVIMDTVNMVTNHLFSIGAPRPNQSTQSQALSAPDFLHQVDVMTQEVVDLVIAQQSLGATTFNIPGVSISLRFNRTVNAAQLRRHKRQFISYTKSHPPGENSTVKDSFVHYLQNLV